MQVKTMNNEKTAHETAKTLTFDYTKEMEMSNLNELFLKNQLLQQQVIAGSLELKAAKLGQLIAIKDGVHDESTKEKINHEISKLIVGIITTNV